MSLKDFSKEQKQYAVLGLLAVATFVILITFGIRFSMGTISTAKLELSDLTAKIGSAEKALEKSQQTSEEYVETVGMLREYLTNAPPERNCYSWATEIIYSKARLANLEVDSIEELSFSQLRRASPKEGAATVSFESYSVRIAAHGGYENAKYFLRLFEQDYPLVRFSGLEISAGRTPESHDIQLYMQWPYNFGDVTNNWDTVSSKSRQMAAVNDGKETAAPRKPAPEPAKEPASPVPAVTTPEPVREPYPPTTRPKVEEAPAPEAIVEPAVPETQNGVGEAEAYAESSSFDAALQTAALGGAEDLPADEAPPIAESEEADPQLAVAEPESIVHEQPVSEPETVAEPVAVIEPQTVAEPELVVEPQPQDAPSSGPAPEDTVDHDLLQMMDAFETTNSAPVTGPPADEAMEEAPLMESLSTSNRWSPSEVGSQSGSETASNDVETGSSEQVNEEAGSKDSTGKGSLWGRFFGGDRKEESNEE